MIAEKEQLKEEVQHWLENFKRVRDDKMKLIDENKALRLQADTYFDEWQALKDEIKVQPMTELQLTKDSSIQSIPLTNEAYEKSIKEGK